MEWLAERCGPIAPEQLQEEAIRPPAERPPSACHGNHDQGSQESADATPRTGERPALPSARSRTIEDEQAGNDPLDRVDEMVDP
jgi:hypothetical protein